ncbi:type II secretion system protein GspL [Pseudomonas cavernicola]|uniref:Type II secretion system protein L n=1 Tax=Pseudomonas cavernicola TaxID=2320866 RepID=A0A418XMU5_9PSED|nr:type II secretion system protein GspL [Pseudomonas cavernicola]RJG13774.1 type II secretion system protein GspL [Pseudomonas cavernicola]
MSQVCIFLPPAACVGADPELEVCRVQAGVRTQLAFAAAVAELSAPWRLVLPVEAVTSCVVQLPTQKSRWLRQALPFAVEELLAEEVEHLHLALGEQLADGRHRVFAVRRSWLADWLTLCAEARPATIQVDADLLPVQGTQLLWLDERWLLGGATLTRMALVSEDWPSLAPVCPLPHMAFAPPEQALPAGIVECQREPDLHLWLASQSAGCNLAQGEFAPPESAEDWLRWRPVLGLVGLWLVLQWGFNLAQSWQLQHESEAYAASNVALYRELFPEDNKLVNLRTQFDQHLAEGAAGGQSRLLNLLGQATGALIAEGAQVRVQQLDFSDSRGDLALQVQAPGFDALERLRERLIAAGLVVQLGSASREATGVSARLVIGG